MSWRRASGWLLLLLLPAGGAGGTDMSLVLLREASVVMHQTRPYLQARVQSGSGCELQPQPPVPHISINPLRFGCSMLVSMMPVLAMTSQ